MNAVNLVDKRAEQAERIARRFATANRTKQGDCTAMNKFAGIRIGGVYEPSPNFGDPFGYVMPKEHNQERHQITRGYAKLLLKRLRQAVKSLKTDSIAVIDFDTLTVWDLQDSYDNGVKFELYEVDQFFLFDFRVNAYLFIQCLAAALTLSTSPTITIGIAKDYYDGDAAHKPLTIDGDYGRVKTLLMPVRK